MKGWERIYLGMICIINDQQCENDNHKIWGRHIFATVFKCCSKSTAQAKYLFMWEMYDSYCKWKRECENQGVYIGGSEAEVGFRLKITVNWRINKYFIVWQCHCHILFKSSQEACTHSLNCLLSQIPVVIWSWFPSYWINLQKIYFWTGWKNDLVKKIFKNCTRCKYNILQ